MHVFQGIGVSPGIAVGRAFIKEASVVEPERYCIQNVEFELNRVLNAIDKSKKELQELYNYALKNIGEHEAKIFSAQIMMLEDEEFFCAVENKVRSEFKNAVWAVEEVAQQFIQLFKSMDSDYIKEKAADVKDICRRMVESLTGVPKHEFSNMEFEGILVSVDLTPSDTARLCRDKVSGFITEIGGKTSHSAIIARLLEIPAVAGIKNISGLAKNGDVFIVDGIGGTVYMNPDKEIMEIYNKKKEDYSRHKLNLNLIKGTKTVTRDGTQLKVAANIGKLSDINFVIEKGGEGVGLFRTEFLYLDRCDFPSEQEQFEIYKKIAQKMEGNPVIIRTLDIGGDKELEYFDMPRETNPFLGCRAIRLCLQNESIWKPQIKAILRASAFGDIKIMFPMITVIDELREAKNILEKVKGELKNEGAGFNHCIEVGMMIETPAAAIMADVFAKEVDFFSIGTNDLIQYTTAVDRMNPQVSHLYNQFNPAVLRLIKYIIECAHKKNIWVSMCGEVAGDPDLIPLLVGLGLDEFSVNPASILETKWVIQNASRSEVGELVDKLLELASPDEVKKFLIDNLQHAKVDF